MLYSRRHTQPLFPEAATGDDDEDGSLGGRADGESQTWPAPRWRHGELWNSIEEEIKRASEDGRTDAFHRGWKASYEQHHYQNDNDGVGAAEYRLGGRNIANQHLQNREKWPVCRGGITVRLERLFHGNKEKATLVRLQRRHY